MNEGSFSAAAAPKRISRTVNLYRLKSQKPIAPPTDPGARLEPWCEFLISLILDESAPKHRDIPLEIFPNESIRSTLVSVAKHEQCHLDFRVQSRGQQKILFMTLDKKGG